MPITPFHFGPGALLKSVLRRRFSFAVFAAANVLARSEIPASWKVEIAAETPPGVIFLSAAIGAWSHVLLDSLMHSDIRPLAPFSDADPLLGACPLFALHAACAVSGALGLALWTFAARRKKRPAGPPEGDPADLPILGRSAD